MFNCNMMVDVLLVHKLIEIRDRRQHLINEKLQLLNAKIIDYNFSVGDEVTVDKYNPIKMESKKYGPYPNVNVFMNIVFKFNSPLMYTFLYEAHLHKKLSCSTRFYVDYSRLWV